MAAKELPVDKTYVFNVECSKRHDDGDFCGKKNECGESLCFYNNFVAGK